MRKPEVLEEPIENKFGVELLTRERFDREFNQMFGSSRDYVEEFGDSVLDLCSILIPQLMLNDNYAEDDRAFSASVNLKANDLNIEVMLGWEVFYYYSEIEKEYLFNALKVLQEKMITILEKTRLSI